MDAMTEHEYEFPASMYIVELSREDIIDLVHAAHVHAEKLLPVESKRLVDAANRLSAQAVYFG